MTPVIRFLILAGLLVGSLSISSSAQTSTVIPDTEAGQHVTVEGVVVKVFTSKSGNTFLNFGAAYPAQIFTGWIPASTPLASDHWFVPFTTLTRLPFSINSRQVTPQICI